MCSGKWEEEALPSPPPELDGEPARAATIDTNEPVVREVESVRLSAIAVVGFHLATLLQCVNSLTFLGQIVVHSSVTSGTHASHAP